MECYICLWKRLIHYTWTSCKIYHLGHDFLICTYIVIRRLTFKLLKFGWSLLWPIYIYILWWPIYIIKTIPGYILNLEDVKSMGVERSAKSSNLIQLQSIDKAYKMPIYLTTKRVIDITWSTQGIYVTYVKSYSTGKSIN